MGGSVESIFTGTFARAVDGRNRVLVPKEVRESLQGEDQLGLYLIPSDRWVFLWPRSYLLAYSAAAGADPFGNLNFNRRFFSKAEFKSFDGMGRIVLPQKALDLVGKGDVVIIGSGRYLELWSPEAWGREQEQGD